MALNLNKNYMCKITINIPKWLVPGWVSLFFAIFAVLSFCMPYTQETYDIPHSGEIVKLYTEMSSDDSKEVKTVYKAIVRENTGNLTSVSLKDVYYHTAKEGQIFQWSESFDKRPILGFFNSFFLIIFGIVWFIGLLTKISD